MSGGGDHWGPFLRLPTTVRLLTMYHIGPDSIYVSTYVSALFKDSIVHGADQCFSTLNFFF